MALAQGEQVQIEKCMKFFFLSAAQASARRRAASWARGNHLERYRGDWHGPCAGRTGTHREVYEVFLFVCGPGKRAQTPSVLSTRQSLGEGAAFSARIPFGDHPLKLERYRED